MKKKILFVLLISIFVLSSCSQKNIEIDCSTFPDHETCQNSDDKDQVIFETCEENPSLEKCKEIVLDCDVNSQDPSCKEDVIVTCEDSGTLDCMFALALAEAGGTFRTINTYKYLSEAQVVFNNLDDENIVIIGNDDTVLSMKYGAVNFKTKSVYEITQLGHVGFRFPTYLNGNYNVDGLYLKTEGFVVYGMIAGVHFEVNTSEVELIPYIHSPNGYSYYEVKNQELIHKISSNIRSASFLSIGAIDIAPDYLTEDIRYFSYDNHYFYTDIKDMTNDFNDSVHLNAVNADNPYYNYYQYVSFRSQTNYTADELNTYVNSKVSTSSGLFDSGEDFINAGEDVYINSAMEMAFAIHESGWGNSWIAQNKNNLFGIDAYDSNPNDSARTFDTVKDCIEYHARYFLGARYFNPRYYVSFGTNFGNKYQGMNYKYASDAFWGEKIAKHYYNLDKALGFKDRNSNTIVLLKPEVVGYYGPTESSPVIYDPSQYNYNGLSIPFVVKKENDEYYSLFLPVGLNDELEMDTNEIMNINDVFYVSKDDVIVIN